MGSLASAEEPPAAEEAAEEPPAAADAAETRSSNCQICAEAPRAVRLVPCGHCSTCDMHHPLITRATARKCPLCRVQFERVAWQSTAPVPLRREPTFEAGPPTLARDHPRAPASPRRSAVRCAHGAEPALLATIAHGARARRAPRRAASARASSARRATGTGPTCRPRPLPHRRQRRALAVRRRGGRRRRRRAVGVGGQPPRLERHSALLSGLASLLGIALPHLESVSGLRRAAAACSSSSARSSTRWRPTPTARPPSTR